MATSDGTTLYVGQVGPDKKQQLARFLDVSFDAQFRLVEDEEGTELQITGSDMGGVFCRVPMQGAS